MLIWKITQLHWHKQMFKDYNKEAIARNLGWPKCS